MFYISNIKSWFIFNYKLILQTFNFNKLYFRKFLISKLIKFLALMQKVPLILFIKFLKLFPDYKKYYHDLKLFLIL